jgi:hypothetical protein
LFILKSSNQLDLGDGELTHNNNNRAICSGNKIPKLVRIFEDQHTNKNAANNAK